MRAIKNDLANATFRPGWLRSVGPGWTNWALESFVDEVAHNKGVDPVALRKQLLTSRGKNAGHAPNSVGGASRLAKVLERAAEKAGWGKDLPEGVTTVDAFEIIPGAAKAIAKLNAQGLYVVVVTNQFVNVQTH